MDGRTIVKVRPSLKYCKLQVYNIYQHCTFFGVATLRALFRWMSRLRRYLCKASIQIDTGASGIFGFFLPPRIHNISHILTPLFHTYTVSHIHQVIASQVISRTPVMFHTCNISHRKREVGVGPPSRAGKYSPLRNCRVYTLFRLSGPEAVLLA